MDILRVMCDNKIIVVWANEKNDKIGCSFEILSTSTRFTTLKISNTLIY